MRVVIYLTGAVLGLALASPCWAQAVTFGGVNPTKIINKPIEIPDAVKPIAQPQVSQTPQFSLMNLLPRITFPNTKPVHGQSQFPTPANMPGKNYLNSFGFNLPKPIQF